MKQPRYSVTVGAERRREDTPHTAQPLDGMEGWTLTQTQADLDDGLWRVIAADGTLAGVLIHPVWAPKEWEARVGGQDGSVVPHSFGAESGAAAARTCAAPLGGRSPRRSPLWHDPDLEGQGRPGV